MPTRKQRRRQQKSRRHEYEYVYVDDEGNEVEVDPAELEQENDGKREARARPPKDRKPAAPATRGRRGIEPPSWRRAGRRGLIFAPILLVAMMLLNRNLSLAQQVAPAVLMVGFFIPFSYFTDSLAYRMYKKRLDRSNEAKSSR
jgi:hypothetical protein